MPILGVIASSTRQGQNVDLGAMFPIQSVYVGASGVSSITFSNIPQTYAHLQLRGITRDSFADTASQSQLSVNIGGAGANYSYQLMNGDGTSANGSSGADSTFYYGFDRTSAANTTASVFGGFIMDILDYANTNKLTTFKTLAGFDANGSGMAKYSSGLWLSTAAITSIRIQPQTGGNYTQYTQVTLYGIKGA
jgi:hypothetical protein